MSQRSHAQLDRELQADRYGLRIAARLNQDSPPLPHDIGERLRVARQQALQRRKRPAVVPAPAPVLLQAGEATALGGRPPGGRWRTVLAAVVPVAALVLGLACIQQLQNDDAAQDAAEIDTELLLDELPPAAYADPGFAQFLKTFSAQEP